jgi:hypothetical protein
MERQMLLKERKLIIAIYLLRYGHITEEEIRLLGSSSYYNKRRLDIRNMLTIPGIYTNSSANELYSFYYIISHRMPVFYGQNYTKYYLKDIKTKSPPVLTERLVLTTIESMRKYFV